MNISIITFTENGTKLAEKIRQAFAGTKTEEAKKLGNARVFNTIIIGVAAKHMDFEKEKWIEVVKKTVPPKTVDINVKAFLAGYEMG